MYKVKMRNILDLIDCVGVQSAVALHPYKGVGLNPLQVVFRANPVVLDNKSCEKLRTLTDSAHTWTVCATIADRPAFEPDRPRGHFLHSTRSKD
jgi:hypothetical protein